MRHLGVRTPAQVDEFPPGHPRPVPRSGRMCRWPSPRIPDRRDSRKSGETPPRDREALPHAKTPLPEQIAAALRQAEAGTPVLELIRKLGIHENTFYTWKRRLLTIVDICSRECVALEVAPRFCSEDAVTALRRACRTRGNREFYAVITARNSSLSHSISGHSGTRLGSTIPAPANPQTTRS